MDGPRSVDRLALGRNRYRGRHVFKFKLIDCFHPQVCKCDHAGIRNCLGYQVSRAADSHQVDCTVLADCLDSDGATFRFTNHAEQTRLAQKARRELVHPSRRSRPCRAYHFLTDGIDRPNVVSAAETHAVLRLRDGFSLDQMVSEYRALRSSVLRLWLAQETSVEHPERVAEIIRFNEAIDQALMESIAAYGKAVETTRKLVLGVLGHDMRAPLTAITMGAGLLANAHQMGVREQKVVGQISVSVERANDMVNDLLDLARCNLSTGIPIQRQTFELRELCTSFVKEVSLAHPEATIVFEGISSLSANFDPQRMGQVISNLVINAIRHGDVKKPIQLRLTGSHGVAQIDVHNWGSPISPDELPYLFNPEARLARATDDSENTHGLGLGLFIANEIVTSHGGTIDVMSSDEDGTTFKVAFPQGS